MATWVANALAHTNARPAGLWMQSSADADGFANNAPTLSISHRDSSHAVISGTIVDVFEWLNSTTTGNTSPWTSTGACNANVGITGNSLTNCKVELGDPTTNTSGNVAAITEAVADGKTRSYYAWTAATNTVYDNDLHGSGDSYSTVSQTSAAPAPKLTLTANVPAGAKITSNVADVKHGVAITVTAQMSRAKNGSAYAAVAQALCYVTFTHTISDTTPTVLSITTSSSYTDATGATSYTFTPADPNATVNVTDGRTHGIKVSDTCTSTATETVATTGYANHFVGANNATTMTVKAQDTAAAFNTTTAAHNVATYAAGTALAPVARNVTATNTDQYGNAWTTARTVQFQGAAISGTGLVVCKDSSDLCYIQGRKITAETGDDEITVDGADLHTFAVAHGLVVGDAVAFAGTLSTKMDNGLDTNTVYYVKTRPLVTTLTLAPVSSGGTITNTAAAVDDCAAATCRMYQVEAHSLTGTESLVFRTASSELDDTYTVGTRYYVSTAGLTAFEFGLNVTSNATAVMDVVTTPSDDCTLTTCEMFIYHPSATADRTIGPDGTASVAWNDTTSTNGTDIVSVYKSTTKEAAKTAYRYNAAVVGTTINNADTAIAWAEDVDANDASYVDALPVIWDNANNTLLVKLNHGIANSAVAAATHTAATHVRSVDYVLYSYDANDQFFLLGDGSAATTTMTGFETQLTTHLAAATAGAFAVGDLFSVSYQALAGNVSIFKLGT